MTMCKKIICLLILVINIVLLANVSYSRESGMIISADKVIVTVDEWVFSTDGKTKKQIHDCKYNVTSLAQLGRYNILIVFDGQGNPSIELLDITTLKSKRFFDGDCLGYKIEKDKIYLKLHPFCSPENTVSYAIVSKEGKVTLLKGIDSKIKFLDPKIENSITTISDVNFTLKSPEALSSNLTIYDKKFKKTYTSFTNFSGSFQADSNNIYIMQRSSGDNRLSDFIVINRKSGFIIKKQPIFADCYQLNFYKN